MDEATLKRVEKLVLAVLAQAAAGTTFEDADLVDEAAALLVEVRTQLAALAVEQ